MLLAATHHATVLYTIGCDADSRTPTLAPVGIEHVMINGTSVVAGGKWCGDGVMAGEWIGRG